jgi:phosphoribosyl 1,2-cyclic phosphate phosphodiesterase
MSVNLYLLGTGTSQGVPVLGCHCQTCSSADPKDKRLRTSALFEVGKKTILIDTGPDLRTQLLSSGHQTIDAVLFTHEHQDHTSGLDDLRPFVFKRSEDNPIRVYAQERVLKRLRQQYAYIFENSDYPGVPRFDFYTIGHQATFIDIFGTEVRIIHGRHGELPVLGFRIGDISYLTDVNKLSEDALDVIRGSSRWVLGALRYEKHYSHFSIHEAIEHIKKVGVEEAYLTHLSHHLPPYSKFSQELPSGVQPAYDGMILYGN